MRCIGLHVGDAAQLQRGVLALLHEGPVDDQVVHHAQHAHAGHAEGEADGAGALGDVGILDHLLGHDVRDVVDAGMAHALEDLRLVEGVVGHPAAVREALARVPLEVVGLDVQNRGRVHGQGLGPVQLEAGQLHGEDVVGGLVQDGFHHRTSDVAHRAGLETGREQHRLEHLGGGGLAIGTGDGEPRHGTVGLLQTPRQFDLAPDRDAARGGLGQQRRRRTPTRGGDDQVDVVGQGRGGTSAQTDVGIEHLQHGGLFGIGRAVVVVQDGHLRANVEQPVSGGEAGTAKTRDDDLGLRPRRGAVGTLDPVQRCTVLRHYWPTTHCA